jgi:hypothetical protein
MKPSLLRLAIAAVLAAGMIFPAGVILPAQALDNQTKIDLQAALLSFLEHASDEAGRFAVIDRSSGTLTRVYAGAMHPKIVPFGDDQILCIEMFDDAGGKHEADFVLRRHNGGWMVVDILFNQRPLLKKALRRSN